MRAAWRVACAPEASLNERNSDEVMRMGQAAAFISRRHQRSRRASFHVQTPLLTDNQRDETSRLVARRHKRNKLNRVAKGRRQTASLASITLSLQPALGPKSHMQRVGDEREEQAAPVSGRRSAREAHARPRSGNKCSEISGAYAASGKRDRMAEASDQKPITPQ